MSMYYNTQIVRLLMNERIEEARRAGLVNRARDEECATHEVHQPRVRPAVFGRRHETNTASCSC
jgi:hypothetical protein